MAKRPVTEHFLERLARRIVTAELDVPVIWFDRQQQDCQPDAEIIYADRTAFMETVTDVDAHEAAMWRELEDRRSRIASPIASSWLAWVQPRARLNRIRSELPTLLEQLDVENWPDGEEVAHPQLKAIGVARLSRLSDQPENPFIALQPDTWKDLYAEPADFLHWLDSFVSRCHRKAEKLAATGAAERHLFVWATSSTEGHVDTVLRRAVGPHTLLPARAPSLPPEITHLWIASTLTRRGALRWSPERGWTACVHATNRSDEPPT